MSDSTTTIAELRELIRVFVEERDWRQFHSPKNLSMALAIEAAELMEHFQWIDAAASRALAEDPAKLAAAAEELADVIAYGLALANELGLDVSDAIRDKMEKNVRKYPADEFRGRWGRNDPGGGAKSERIMTDRIRKLAIVGASARAAAFSAIRAGYEVVAADMFADADLARVARVTRIDNYPEGLADWLAATNCDAWMYTGALENHPDLVDQMAAFRPLLGNCGAALRDVRDPIKLQALCRDSGVPFPETRAEAKGLPLDGSWLCKTYRGASGSGVWSLNGEAALDRAMREHAVFQQLVPGVPSAAIFNLSQFGAMPFGITHQWLGEPDKRPWQYVGSIGLVDAAANVRSQLSRCAQALAANLGLRGLVGIDFILRSDEVWIVEVNPRFTASIELFEQAIPFATVGFHVVACQTTNAQELLDLVDASAKDFQHCVFAKLIVYAPQEAVITQGFSDWAMSHRSLDPRACRLADIPTAGEVIAEGRPVLTAFARGDSTEDCERELNEWVAEIVARLYGDL